MDSNPVLDYLEQITTKAELLFVPDGRRSVALPNASEKATAKFVIDRLRERFLQKETAG